MKRILTLIFTLTTLANLSQAQSDQLSVLNDDYFTMFGIFFLGEDKISEEEFTAKAGELLPDFVRKQEIPNELSKDAFSVRSVADPIADFTPPDAEYLGYYGYGLSAQEIADLQNPTGALELLFWGNKEDVIEKQATISQLIYEITEGKSVAIFDINTYQTFSRTEWKNYRIDNFQGEHKNVAYQMIIHAYREENQLCRAVTLGMNKFCLPDISIKGFSCNDQASFANLINVLTQTLSENPFMTSDSTVTLDLDQIKNPDLKELWLNSLDENATKKATVNLQFVLPEEGDIPNAQYRLEFNDPGYSSPQEEQTALLSTLFGSSDDISHISHTDQLLEASKKAKKKLLKEHKPRFLKGLEPGYSLLVKGPFTTDSGGNEWMWVEVTKWKKRKIEGILQNEPFEIKGLKAGAIVSVEEKEIFDYILYKPDGTIEGNTTGEIIQALDN